MKIGDTVYVVVDGNDVILGDGECACINSTLASAKDDTKNSMVLHYCTVGKPTIKKVKLVEVL